MCVCVCTHTHAPVHTCVLHVYLTEESLMVWEGFWLLTLSLSNFVTLASYLTSLNFCFLSYEMGIAIISISDGFS